MKKYAYANNDGGLWCSKTHAHDIDICKSCENCEHQEDCENDGDHRQIRCVSYSRTM